jgi:hypothetical protein
MPDAGSVSLEKPIAKAAEHRVLPLGIPFYAMCGIVLLLVLVSIYRWPLAIAVAIASYVLVRSALHLEPHPIRAFRLWRRYGRHSYDAGARHCLQQLTGGFEWPSALATFANRFLTPKTSRI